MANLKAQGLYDVADPDHDPENGDIYEKELFKGKQSFVYSVLVTSLQTEKGRELVKEFEGDARSIILKLHHYHTKSNVAQHDIITLTTDITNLTLNDSWKGTVRQFLSHFKEKLRLLDSLVPVSDQLPETTRITFLQRAVQQNYDLRQIHVMDFVWRFKTDSTDALTFDTYYNLLWDAAHQYDLHQVKKGPQRKAFFSQQEEISDDDEYANAEEQFSTDPEPEEHSPYSVYQSSFHTKIPQKSFLPPNIWETLSESTKQMIIEHNKKVKLNNPTPYPSGSKTKPNPTLGKSTPAPQQVHQHSQDEPTEESPPDTSTQTMVNKCLAESGIDPTDIQNVMSVSYAKRNISSHASSRQIQTHQRYVFARVNQSNDLPSLPPLEPITHAHLHDSNPAEEDWKSSPNLILDPPKGEDQPQDLTSDVFVYGRPNPDGSDNTPPMSIINFDDLLGRTFLLPMDENGERKRATISEHVNDLCQEQVSREDQVRFKLKTDGDQLDDLISYNQLMEYLEDKTDTGPLEDGFYRFKCIKDHKGPYTSSNPEYNGSSYNLLIEWETGEQTWETKDRITTSGRKLLFMTRNTSPMHQRDTRRLEYTLYLMSNTVENSRLDLWQMDISPKNPWKLSIQELSS